MSDFQKSLDFVMKWEGGDKVTDHASDPGGLTKYGISQRAYPNVNIRALTLDQAAEIYRRDYWDRLRCNDLAWPLNLVMFDSAVNCGAGRSGRWLQAAAGAHVDGAVGPATIKAVAAHDAQDIARNVVERRDIHYRTSANFGTFGKGWLNRLTDLRKVAGL